MFERLRNSNLAYVIALSACLNGVVGCGYFSGTWDTKYYKFQPTFEDRTIARTMIMDKDVLVEKSFNEIAPLIQDESLKDESKKTSLKNAMRAMVNEKNKEDNKDPIAEKYVRDISEHIKLDEYNNKARNEAQVKSVFIKLITAAVEHEKKEYTVNGLKFKVKDNCIYFTELEISVPLTDIKVSDADVIGFSSDIQKALRWRMDTARRVRLGSGSAQILAAAAGASLGLATGSVATAAALAAFSAVIPELQNIFQARDRSVAYEQGLEMIQDSESRYYQSRTANATNNTIGTVSTTELTKSGSQLLTEISACLKVVDKALSQTIPKIEDLLTANGRHDEALGLIKVVPPSFSIPVGGSQTVQIINSKAITYAVSDAKAVKVVNFNPDKPTDQITIIGVGTGSARVTVYDVLGHSGYFGVTVGEVDKNSVQKASTGITTTITTDSATKVGATTATLYGTVVINSPPTDVWFEYSKNNNIEETKPHQVFVKAGTFQVEKVVSDLSAGTITSFRVVAMNTTSPEKSYGKNQYFLTSKVTTGKADHISVDSATLNGEIITQDTNIDWVFVWDTKTVKDVTIQKFKFQTGVMNAENGKPNKVSFPIEGLTPGTKYNYKLVAKNDAGEMPGNEQEFVTKGTSVQTGIATNLGTDVATLNGTVTTDCCTTKVWFEYGTESGKYGKTINAEEGTIIKSTPSPAKAQISSLTPGKYYFRIATELDKVNGTESSFEIK